MTTTTEKLSVTKKTKSIALVGNPNVGKTTLFNNLTGMSQRTGHFAGVTVEKKVGQVKLSHETINLVDLPGTYSLSATSPDEIIVTDVLLSQQQGTNPIEAIVFVADAANLERNLYLLTQVIECQIPVILALNMSDVASKKGIQIDYSSLAQALGCKVISLVANRGKGMIALKEAMEESLKEITPCSQFKVDLGEQAEKALAELISFGKENEAKLGHTLHRVEALRILLDPDSEARRRVQENLGSDFEQAFERISQPIGSQDELFMIEPEARYQKIEEIISQSITYPAEGTKSTIADKVDSFLTHPLLGSLIFFFMMACVFQSIYSWSAPFMDMIDETFGWLGGEVAGLMSDGTLQSLVVDGIIAGIGSVVIFLPQILVLFAFIAILEDCGYMARAAFLMDKIMRWAGLSGHSFVPMLSSFACAIPGVMATRVIENKRDRFTTILVAPLMSCSARLPVYTIMIAAFIPTQNYLGGWIGLQGMVLFFMYILGIIVAIPVAWTLKKTLLKGDPPTFVMEMPGYKWPDLKNIFMRVYNSGKAFMVRAGTVIFAVTVLIWGLAYFPRSTELEAQYALKAQNMEALFQSEVLLSIQKIDPSKEELSSPEISQLKREYPQIVDNLSALEENFQASLAENDQARAGHYLRSSFLGQAGTFLEPIFLPLGWNWKIGIATIASFPAREVIIATLGIIYNLGGDEDEESTTLREALKSETWPDGRPVFTALVALSIMIFFALCCQCGATLAVIWRETGSWKWPVLTFSYMTILAYLGALLTYQVGSLLGY